MSSRQTFYIIFLIVSLSIKSFAVPYYVATNGNDGYAGTAWTNALLTISNAIAKAANNDTVLVSNGIYVIQAQISVDKAIYLRSFNSGSIDFTNTIVNAGRIARCMSINNVGAVIEGFTFTNGYATDYGGGLYIINGIVSRCLVVDNIASKEGGGVKIIGSSTMQNCNVVGNLCSNDSGGGIQIAGDNCLVTNCVIMNNIMLTYNGGGVNIKWGGKLANSLICGNSNVAWGGGVACYRGGTVENAIISNNISRNGDGGGASCEDGGTYKNCLICNNSINGNTGGGAFLKGTGNFYNCTIIGNSQVSSVAGGGLADYLGTNISVVNCIIYSNVCGGTYGLDMGTSATGYTWYCCSTTNVLASRGNVLTNPGFAGYSLGNYHLVNGSPCINAGTNETWMINAPDLDGHSRIDRYSGIVDMGCYEHLPQGTMYSVP